MPKLRRQNFCYSFKDKIPLKLRWAPGVAGARRNPGREDGSRWNSSSFLSPADVDGHPEDGWGDSNIEVIIDDLSSKREDEGPQPMIVSLLDIAQPAKVKGITSEFEVVKTRRVIALEDVRDGGPYADEDWERIYDEEILYKEPRTYSAVLASNDSC